MQGSGKGVEKRGESGKKEGEEADGGEVWE